MTPTHEHSTLAAEKLYERDYPTLITPLVSDGHFKERVFRTIEASLRASQKNIRDVYGDDYKDADELIYISTISALSIRVDKALEARNQFLTDLFPEWFVINDRQADRSEAAHIIEIILRIAREGAKAIAEADIEDATRTKSSLPPEMLKNIKPSAARQLLDRLGDQADETAAAVYEFLSEPKDAPSALAFLAQNPTLGSIELANKTHPLHWSAVEPMRHKVDRAIQEVLPDTVIFGENHSIQDSSADLEIRRPHFNDQGELQFVIVRKKHLHAYDAERNIAVIERAAYLIDLRPRPEEDLEHREICELLNKMNLLRDRYLVNGVASNKTKAAEMPREWRANSARTEQILEVILALPPLERRRWVQPTTTSYYAANNTRLAESCRQTD